jgi:hypothetical protein
MFIILWELPSGNVVTDFSSEHDAWEALRSWARDDGLEAVAGLSLMHIEDGEPILIAMEDDLVRRVTDLLAAGERSAVDDRAATAGRVTP